MSPSVRTFSCTTGASASSTSGRVRSAGQGAASPSHGSERRRYSSVLRARMYTPLKCSSFLVSKNAGARFTSLRRNCATISAMGRISTPSVGPQPSSARWLAMASGR